jgi:hypothetical protein
MEFISLKNALIAITPLYWESQGLPLLHMGCTTSGMLIALLRDVVAQGTVWGFAAANVTDFRSTLSRHVAYVVRRCRATVLPWDSGLTFIPARNFIYMDTTPGFLGRGQRTINFLTTRQHANATLAADRVYVVTGWAILDRDGLAMRLQRDRRYAGISSGGGIIMPEPSSGKPGEWGEPPEPIATGRLIFARDATFIVRLGRPVGGTFFLNEQRISANALAVDPENSQFFRVPGVIRTSNRQISFRTVRDTGFTLSDFIFTPA